MPSSNHTQVNTVAVGGGSTDVAVVVWVAEVRSSGAVQCLNSSRNVELTLVPV